MTRREQQLDDYDQRVIEKVTQLQDAYNQAAHQWLALYRNHMGDERLPVPKLTRRKRLMRWLKEDYRRLVDAWAVLRGRAYIGE